MILVGRWFKSFLRNHIYAQFGANIAKENTGFPKEFQCFFVFLTLLTKRQNLI